MTIFDVNFISLFSKGSQTQHFSTLLLIFFSVNCIPFFLLTCWTLLSSDGRRREKNFSLLNLWYKNNEKYWMKIMIIHNLLHNKMKMKTMRGRKKLASWVKNRIIQYLHLNHVFIYASSCLLLLNKR